jgi:hypothetical protein
VRRDAVVAPPEGHGHVVSHTPHRPQAQKVSVAFSIEPEHVIELCGGLSPFREGIAAAGFRDRDF